MLSRIAALWVCVCGVYYLDVMVRRELPALAAPGDFVHYYRAGQAVLKGVSPFNDPEYLYPPVVAFLAVPFALFNLHAARWIWFLISQACLLGAAFLIWRASGKGWISACCVTLVWAFGGAAEESLALGQIGPLLVLLIAVALTQGPRRQGAAAAAGFCLKYVPGVLLAGFVLARSGRALASFAWVAILLSLVPWAALWYGLPGAKAPVTENYWMGTPALLSWSVPSTLLRILDPPSDPKRLPHDWEYGNAAASLHLPFARRTVSLTTAALILTVGAIILFAASPGRLSTTNLPWALAGLLSLGLAAAPVCWTHYQIMQYPGLALLLSHAARQRQWRIAAAASICAAMLYPIPVAVLRSYYVAHGGWTAVSPATLYFWTSTAPAASLFLFGIFVWNARQRGTPPRNRGRANDVNGE